MAPCCIGFSVKEFTVLLIHVLHTSHPAALERSTRYVREIVDRLFSKYTHIDISNIQPHDYKFRNLIAESRLEIAFAGKNQKGLKSLIIKFISKRILKGLAVVFEVD